RPPPFRRDAGRRDRQDPGHPGQRCQAHDLSCRAEAARIAGAVCEVLDMQHLTEQELVLHHYHDEDSPAAVAQHLVACDVCRAEYGSIQKVLALVDEMPVPERAGGYGEQVWSRLRWKLGSPRHRNTWRSALAA